MTREGSRLAATTPLLVRCGDGGIFDIG